MKDYGKVKASIISSIIGFVLVVGLVLAFVPMHIGRHDYKSFAGALNLSREVYDGISCEYEIEGEFETKELNETMSIMASILNEEGFKSVNIYKKGENKIRLDINSTLLETDKGAVEELLKIMASGRLEFKTVNQVQIPPELAESEDPPIIIDGYEHISKIEKVKYRTSSGLNIEFNKEGKALYEDAVGKSLYMFVGDTAWPSAQNNQISANNDPSSTSMFLMFESSKVVNTYYNTFKAGTMPLELNADTIEIVYTRSETAALARTILTIAVGVVFAALMILTIIKFKGMGVLSLVSTLISAVLMLFLLQAMNWAVIGMSSMILFAIVLVINYLVNGLILRQIHAEYGLGKSLETACEDGFRKSRNIILELASMLALMGLIVALLGKGELYAIGTIITIGAIEIVLASLVLMPILFNCMYSFAPQNLKLYGLKKREEN